MCRQNTLETHIITITFGNLKFDKIYKKYFTTIDKNEIYNIKNKFITY